MSIQAVLLPVFAQIALVFALLGLMAGRRQRAFAAGLRMDEVALSGEGFPSSARQAANCYANQFEMPVLFLAAVILGIVLHQTGWLFVATEWIFVAFRLAHAGIHTTSNNVPLRGALFLGSAAAAFVLWFLIFVGTVFGGLR